MKTDKYAGLDTYGNKAPADATHFDAFWQQFLKADGDVLYVCEHGHWTVSQHKDGVGMLANGECEVL